MKNRILLLAMIFAGVSLSKAQNNIGYAVDNYSGIHGVIMNPAAVVDSKFRTDINLIAVSSFAGSDYFSVDLGSALKGEDGFDFEGSAEKFSSNSNNFFLNLDVFGPSFMFNWNKKSSVALTTRLRGFMNMNNVNGVLYESIAEGFDASEDFDFEMKNFSGTVHVWGEVGVTYGRELINKNQHFLTGGVTLKYLLGAGSSFFDAAMVEGSYDASASSLTSTGELSYGTSPGFEGDNVDFKDLTPSFGADLGFIYEYRPDVELDSISHANYKLKMGVSITDIGSITYDESVITTYDLQGSINAGNFEDEDLDTVLDEEYPSTETVEKRTISLPTAMNLFVDYKLKKRLYLSMQGSFSLVGKDKEYANRIINSVTATPRLETRWLSFYLPVSLRQYDGLAMGVGLRLGPVTIGSGSIISNYIADSSRTTDVYAAVKIPIYRD